MTISNPLVSIITPSYNQGVFIEDTILSVKNQDYQNVEHIIIDGGSTDNTMDILKRYEGAYNMRWTSEPDRGQSDAINKGWRASNGQIVGWLNSDDVYLEKNTIGYIVEQFASHQDADIVYGETVYITKDNVVLAVRPAFPWISYNRLLRTNLIWQQSAFFRRAVVETNYLDINLDFVMDYELWLRLAKSKSRFKHVNKVLSALRIHSAAKTCSQRSELNVELKEVLKAYGQVFGIRYELFRRLDSLLLTILQWQHLKTVLELRSCRRRHRLVFPARFTCLPKAMLNQLLPLR